MAHRKHIQNQTVCLQREFEGERKERFPFNQEKGEQICIVQAKSGVNCEIGKKDSLTQVLGGFIHHCYLYCLTVSSPYRDWAGTVCVVHLYSTWHNGTVASRHYRKTKYNNNKWTQVPDSAATRAGCCMNPYKDMAPKRFFYIHNAVLHSGFS